MSWFSPPLLFLATGMYSNLLYIVQACAALQILRCFFWLILLLPVFGAGRDLIPQLLHADAEVPPDIELVS
jgi:hypothetical protein